MKRKYFGTDGVRGRSGGPLINPAFLRRLAYAAGTAMHPGTARLPSVVIGRDTRASGEALEAAVCEGLLAAGWNVTRLGVAPTPAVALATRESGGSLGVVLTASHNPATDNGIKFFDGAGRKLEDETELKIESALPPEDWHPLPAIGVANHTADGRARYVERMSGLFASGALGGWTIAFDGANGATCTTTPAVLRKLGAEVEAIGCEPDGANINQGIGSEHPEKLAELVKDCGARIGIAHDGDGDRVVLCDENGSVLDGDEVLTLLACHGLKKGTLSGGRLVVTVQSNLGVDAAVKAAGGSVVRSDVGDRYVIAAMEREGATLGGESSGHFVFPRISPTGDGLVGALEVVKVMLETGEPLSALRRALSKFPQETDAIRVRAKRSLGECAKITQAIQAAEAALGDDGRVLVRYSGTEPKIRLLVEGKDSGEVGRWLEALRDAVAEDLEVVRD